MKFRFLHIDKLIAILLLTGISILGYNEVVNYHIHITADGKMLGHSHPHSDSKSGDSSANHHHSNVQFVNFDKMGHQFTTSQSVTEINPFVELIDSENRSFYILIPTLNNYLLLNQFRAPPIC